jgi:hypothetical protein
VRFSLRAAEPFCALLRPSFVQGKASLPDPHRGKQQTEKRKPVHAEDVPLRLGKLNPNQKKIVMTGTKITMLTAVLLLGSFMGATQAASLKAAPVKPSNPGVITAPSGGATKDHYCKNGHAKFASCSADFIAPCKKVGGTMSDVQGWGGRTCFTPS